MLRRVPPPLAALLAVAAVLSVAWSFVTPVLSGPDEDQHVAYVQRIVEAGELPQRGSTGDNPFSTELEVAASWAGLFQLPLNPRATPNTTEAEERAFAAAEERLPAGASGDGRGYAAAYANPPLYYAYESVPYAIGSGASLFTRVHLMRLAQVPLILLVVAMAWVLCAELLPNPRWARVLAAGVVAVHPLLAFMSGVVNPDIALAAVWSAFLVVAVRLVKHGPTMRRAVVLGLLCAASALIQPRGLGIGLPAAVALGLSLLRFRPPLRVGARLAAVSLGLAFAGVALYVLVVSVLGTEASGGQLQATTASPNLRELLTTTWRFYLPPLRFMTAPPPPLGFRYVFVESFFGVFGSLDVFVPAWLYGLLYSLALYGLVLLAVCLVLRAEALRRRWAELVTLLVATGTFLGLLHVAQYQALEASGGANAVLVGRYLLPLIALYGLAIAFVATTLPGRWGRGFALVVLVAGVLLGLTGLGAGVTRWYA